MSYNIFSIAKIDRIKCVVQKFNFPYALIKGDALSLQIYGCPGKRDYGDIDILIDRVNLKNAKKILKSEGFLDTAGNRAAQVLLLSSSHQVSPWIKDISPFGLLEVDLNVDIFWGEFEGIRPNINGFLDDTVISYIYDIPFRTLTPIKALLQLMLHHYKDMNSIFLLYNKKTIRKEKFEEIYLFICNNIDRIPVDLLYNECVKYNAIPYAYYILYYTYEVVKDDLLLPYINSLRNDTGEALLNCYGLSNKERRKWMCDFNTRLYAHNIQSQIEAELTNEDWEKIEINKNVMGFGK